MKATHSQTVVQRYEGEKREEQFDGEGAAWFEGGHTYKGVFSKGRMEGCGVFTHRDGLKYEGEFVSNMPMGQGTFTWPDGSSYTGDVYRGIRHGTGTYKCAQTGVIYTGQWHQGKRHGKGTLYYNEEKSSWYKGDWVMNNREGWGVRCYTSGNIYSGEWKNNQRHGEGTMTWLKLGQEYVGKWQEGVQHGQGTHAWLFRRDDGSQYSQSNRYTGNFIQGQRHGKGTFYYAGGAVYEGEWKNNRKHGQGIFTFKDGRVFKGEFVDNQMISNLNGNGVPSPLGACQHMALNIDCLLYKFPEKKREAEYREVEFVVLRQNMELRSIYSFYSRLGRTHSSDNTLLLSRLQFWRLLKDCYIHHCGVTLIQIDRFIREDADSVEIHSPFTPMLFPKLLSCLVNVAYHLYNQDMTSQNNLLAACFSRLMTDDILPNAKTDLCLLDHKLNTLTFLKILTAESHDPNKPSSCLDLEITFLEFFEVLLGCAEVKCREDQSMPDSEASRLNLEVVDHETVIQIKSPAQSTEHLTVQDLGIQCNATSGLNKTPQSAEHPEEDERERMLKSAGTMTKNGELELRMQAVNQFFKDFLFPAFDHHQLVTRSMKEGKTLPGD
ncbi:radial spoke head 10 homolog B [Pholidichthys leucotaenia]